MSISTCSYCNSATYYSGMATTGTPRRNKSQHVVLCASDTKKTNPAAKDAWASELGGRIQNYGDTVDKFIDTLLPCSTPYTSAGNIQNAFKAYTAGPGREMLEYDNLVAGLSKLVKPFPAQTRLQFANTFKQQLKFPFDGFVKQHHSTAPDISVSFPGESLGEPSSWQYISTVIESKSEGNQDPFDRDGKAHTDTIEQLAKNARNLMLTHGLLAAFVVGIYGNFVRLARFDHTCALVSVPFNIKKDGPRLLQKFYWHFTHPVVGAHIVGNDPTVMKLSSDDQAWVKSELQRAQLLHWQGHVAEISKGRRVEVYDEKTGRCIPYILYQVLDVNGRLFSRATMVWRAIEDTRIWKNGQLEPDPSRTAPVEPQIMKEAWRQLVRTAEAKFYQKLQAKIKKDEWYGLATMVCGGDLGEFELRWWKDTESRRKDTLGSSGDAEPAEHAQEPDPSNPGSASRLFSSIGSATSPSVSSVDSPGDYVPNAEFPLPHPQHQTYSWRLVFEERKEKGEETEELWHRERSHMRIVIDDVGRPLTEFTSTHELVCAVRDAIRGHQLAWQKAKVMHRDISVGNILIADQLYAKKHAKKSRKKAFTGFLHDYDYSAMDSDTSEEEEDAPSSSAPSSGSSEGCPTETATAPDDPSKFKERTGTYYFMACELLDVPGIIHNTYHDLESFYWVLLWVVIRHTAYRKGADGKELCKKIFKFGDDSASADAKRGWVDQRAPTFSVFRNKPLSHLLANFNELVLDHLPTRRKNQVQVPLNYESVLRVFDEAIAMPGWPQDDWQPCKWFDGLHRTGIADVYPKPEEEGKPLAVITAPFPGKAAAARRPPTRKVHFGVLPPFPGLHPGVAAPRTYHGQFLEPVRKSPKKRSYAFVEKESELDSRGTARTSQGHSRGHSKRPKTSQRMGPATRSQSQMAMESSESLRRSARIQAATEVRMLTSGGA
ncbi:hypothetical protein TRAPUB_11200 [Trametes pubescens]|uniref:Fungal-type protein kinase domain-containing protein n=1 Tax=Trametes pubescens TaxID=154538 RepID=A0A1M2VXJ1_TRAPU|nr:hypothetical protein TRAPUB_11200 [Trametes pubescens]